MTDANPNMALWQRVCVTDPKAVKAITGKQYQGNSPKPYWIVQQLTQEFGPCGIGWGFSILNERMERLSETDILHVAVVQFWFILGAQRGELQQIGQTKAVYAKKDGGLMVDEDAPKKSVTDALVKCASYIGFAGDIFSGRWDDSKYVAWAREQYAEPAKPASPIPESFRSKPTGETITLPEDRATIIELAASLAVNKFDKGDKDGAYDEVSGLTDSDEKLYLWQVLAKHSALRTFLKKRAAELREQEPA
jgi:hypothetical protein